MPLVEKKSPQRFPFFGTRADYIKTLEVVFYVEVYQVIFHGEAQYREMEVFTQFSSDLDAATKEQLEYGSGLMELLKQPLYHPLSLHEKVITLCAATHKVMLGIEKAKIKQFQADLLRHFDSDYPEIGQEIEEKKVLTEELIEKIVETAKEFKKSRC